VDIFILSGLSEGMLHLLGLLVCAGQTGSNTCPGHKAAAAVLLEIYGHPGCAPSTQSIANEPCALHAATCMRLDGLKAT